MVNQSLLEQMGFETSEIKFILNLSNQNKLLCNFIQPIISENKILIGNDGCYPIYVLPTGVFVQIENKLNLLNSSLKKLIQLIEYYEKIYSKEVENLSDNEMDERVYFHIEQLKKIDPIAFQDTNSHWSCIADEMIAGHL